MVQYLKTKKHEATVLLINPQNPHVLLRFISTDGASCACSFRLFVTKRSFLLPLYPLPSIAQGT